jgi:serine/threonine protein kinase
LRQRANFRIECCSELALLCESLGQTRMDSVRAIDSRIEAGTVVANYVVEDLLGRGTEGCVYLARDSLLGRQVALKTLREGVVGETRGVEEARMLAGLEHPNIVRVYHARRHDGVWFVIYEYLPGGSLQSQIQRLGPLPLRRALDLMAQAASGLAHAHGAGILHRDVKPQNLLLSRAGDIKLADFGLALDLRARAKTTGQPIGTPAFLAPELWSGSTATPAADVFSLGVCLYYTLTGRLPFVARDPEQLCRAQLELEPKLPVGLPAAVRGLVLAMMAKDAESRPSSHLLSESLRALSDNPYRTATPQVSSPRLNATNPFVAGGGEQAARRTVRTGPDAVYISEFLSALRARPRGIELAAPTAAHALLLSDVALEHSSERHEFAVRLTLPNAGLLHDLISRKLERVAPGSLSDACALLLEPARELAGRGLVEVCVRRALTEEQRRDLEVLVDAATAIDTACVLVGASSELPALEGFRRVETLGAPALRFEHEERLALWIELATGGRYTFSRDGLRLAAEACEVDGRFWPRLAQDSLLIAAAAGLPVVTSWAVLGACAQAGPCHSIDDVPAAWRRRPSQWPTAEVAKRLAALRTTTAAGASREPASSTAPMARPKNEIELPRSSQKVISNK